MVLPKGLLPDFGRLTVKRLGPRVVALGMVQQGQIVQAHGIIGVVLPKGLLVDLQGLLVQRLGPRVVALVAVQFGQIVQALGIIGCFSPRAFFKISDA